MQFLPLIALTAIALGAQRLPAWLDADGMMDYDELHPERQSLLATRGHKLAFCWPVCTKADEEAHDDTSSRARDCDGESADGTTTTVNAQNREIIKWLKADDQLVLD